MFKKTIFKEWTNFIHITFYFYTGYRSVYDIWKRNLILA